MRRGDLRREEAQRRGGVTFVYNHAVVAVTRVASRNGSSRSSNTRSSTYDEFSSTAILGYRAARRVEYAAPGGAFPTSSGRFGTVDATYGFSGNDARSTFGTMKLGALCASTT